jgi:iron complex outermembrane receptor protein
LDLGKATLKVITAYRQQKAVTNVDNDGSPIPIADYFRSIRQNQFSQELQLSGKTLGDRLTYVGGLYYLRENATIAIRQNGFTGFYAAQRAAGISRLNATDAEIQANFRQTNDTYAAYGNLVFKIADKLGISGGLRYGSEDKHIGETAYQINRLYSIFRDSQALTTPQAPGYYVSAARTFNSVTPTVGIQYQAAPAAFFYATYAKGFKSGGFDGRPISGLTSPSSFDPEKVASYEIGTKLNPFGRLLRVNIAAFHIDYNNLQVSSVINTNGLSTNVIRNAGNARIQGIEVEALLRPMPGLEIAANGSYLDAKLKSLATGVPFTLSDHLTNTPKWVLNPSIQYTLDTGDAQSVTARIDYAYTSRVFYDLPNSYAVNAAGTGVTANGPNLFPTVQNGYGLLNARLSYSLEDWTVAAFATNLTDERYRTYGFSSTAAGITEAYYGPPRQYGVTVTRRF